MPLMEANQLIPNGRPDVAMLPPKVLNSTEMLTQKA
jgi:hypothetical protein